MILVPPETIALDQAKLIAIDETNRSIYRLIVFDQEHHASDLLNRYLEAVEHLRDVLSIKNAQQEAHNIEEAEQYLVHLRKGLEMVIDEISNQHTFSSSVDLFRLFRLIAPKVAARNANHFRQSDVQFGLCNGADPKRIPHLIEQLFFNLGEIKHPVIRAIYLHHEMIRIHPFSDGNGRVSRMAKNWLLMYDLYPPMFINNFSDKQRYIEKLQASFLAIEKDPHVFHSATREFFEDELQRIKASTGFILNRMLKNPNITFDSLQNLDA